MEKQDLQRRNTILTAIVNISQQLFVAGDFEEGLARGLGDLGRALGVTHIYIFQNSDERNGRAVSHRYEWSARRESIEFDSPEFQKMLYTEMGLTSWEQALPQGEIVQGLTRHFSPEAQSFLYERGVLSLIAAPIRQGERWWGVVVCDDHDTERQWTHDEIDAMRSLGNILGAAFTTQHL